MPQEWSVEGIGLHQKQSAENASNRNDVQESFRGRVRRRASARSVSACPAPLLSLLTLSSHLKVKPEIPAFSGYFPSMLRSLLTGTASLRLAISSSALLRNDEKAV